MRGVARLGALTLQRSSTMAALMGFRRSTPQTCDWRDAKSHLPPGSDLTSSQALHIRDHCVRDQLGLFWKHGVTGVGRLDYGDLGAELLL